MVTSFQIGVRTVGAGAPCFVIAEAGVNHNGDLAMARQLVDVAARAGADAVKFQTFSAERLVTRDAPQADYQRRNTGIEESQFEMLKRLELSEEAHRSLQSHCRERGILFLSTPFDEQAADFLAQLGVPAFKVPSGEITNTPFLAHLASKNLPMIVSTGMATMEETGAAVDAIRDAGNPPIALLQCVSNYPAEPSGINLRAMQTLSNTFRVPAGYSDHTDGIDIALASVALGACIVEKHFTLDRNLPGPDHKASLTPEELDVLIAGIRRVEAALGDGQKQPTPAEAATATVARKSLVAARDISAGEVISADALVARRPGTGLSPARLESLIGRRVTHAIAAGELLAWDHLA